MNDTRYGLRLRRDGDTAWLILSRPDRHNALDERLIAALTEAIGDLADDDDVRRVVLTGDGKSFCAGADLDWMRRTAALPEAENHREALALAHMMQALDEVPKPTIAAVNGNAYGGGVGLVACCDIAIAASGAAFVLSEARLGIVPGVISPYLVRAVGPRAARFAIVTARPFDADTARDWGLVHQVVAAGDLDTTVRRTCDELAAVGPNAIAGSKDLVATVASRPIDDGLIAETARRIAAARATPEGREGTAAFLEKRRPKWSR